MGVITSSDGMTLGFPDSSTIEIAFFLSAVREAGAGATVFVSVTVLVSEEPQPARTTAAARTAAGLTQEAVADRSGIHVTGVSRIERGMRDPRISTVLRLADALGVPASRLVDGVVSD